MNEILDKILHYQKKIEDDTISKSKIAEELINKENTNLSASSSYKKKSHH